MPLKFFLLDGAQGLLFIVPIFLFIHTVITVLIEGSVLYHYKYKSYGKSLADAFYANLVSLVIGLFLISPFQSLAGKIDDDNWYIFVLLLQFYIQTILVEGAMLRLLNKTFPVKKLIIANLVMNLITYIILAVILKYFLS